MVKSEYDGAPLDLPSKGHMVRGESPHGHGKRGLRVSQGQGGLPAAKRQKNLPQEAVREGAIEGSHDNLKNLSKLYLD